MPHANSSLYDEEDLHGNYDPEEPNGLHGLVQVGATVQTAKELLDEAVKSIRAHTGWDDATVRALVSHSYTPAEGVRLKQVHAQRAAMGLHGLVSLGKHNDPFGAFFSQFDPTWPKAKFGSMVRSAIIAVAAPLGIPAGPMLDGFAGMAQNFQGHPHAGPGPLPPMPAPAALPPQVMAKIPSHHRKMSTGTKVVIAGGIAVGGFVVWKVFFARKTNPKRRRRNPSKRRRSSKRRR